MSSKSVYPSPEQAIAAEVASKLAASRPTALTELESMKQELTQLREAVEWRPIETAPEGMPVLVFDSWHTPRYSIGGIYKFTYATHWMPLPAPPADAVEVSRED